MALTTLGKVVVILILIVVVIAAVLIVVWRKSVNRKREYRILFLRNENDLDYLTDCELAGFVCSNYQKDGYDARQLRDGLTAAHYIITRDGEDFVVSGFSLSKEYCVGREAVQIALSSQAFYHAQGLVAVTNRSFSKEAQSFMQRTGIRALDRQQLATICLSNQLAYEKNLFAAEKSRCPLCGSKTQKMLVEGVAVYRCRRFPECNGIQK